MFGNILVRFYMSEKIENLLNVSMNITEEQREENSQLSVGYNKEDKTWEFVVRYAGSKEDLEAFFGHPFVFLYNQYAISRGTKAEIERLATNPNVEWIEKPKTMEYAVMDGIRVSCINPVTPPQGSLTGKGIVIGIIDSGIDVFHPDFINDNGKTRILGIWDQTGNGDPPEHYLGGTYYREEMINEAIQMGRLEGRKIVPLQDLSGHGTHVAGIAAGNGRASNGRLKGVAPEANLLIVKLGTPTESDFPRTTQVMTGVDFCVRFALERNLSLVINLSFGNNYGDHEGTSLFETYLNSIVGLGKITIVAGMGNQGVSGKHTSGVIAENQNDTIVSFIVGPGETGFGLQIWKNYVDVFDVILRHPSGQETSPFRYGTEQTETRIENTQIIFLYGNPVPYRVNQEIYISFLPVSENGTVDMGQWEIILIPRTIIDGRYEMWLPDAGLNGDITKFLRPTPDLTITIPATTDRVISVGAYDALTDLIAPFSGRGSVLTNNKPDLVAPGVNVESCAPGGGYTIKSGTSMAAPFVSGSAALLMECGIVMRNDRYLYGEKVKAYLRKGARKLPGFYQYPNNVVGYGALCVKESIPN